MTNSENEIHVWNGAIQLGFLPKNPRKSTEGPDEVMRVLSEYTGQEWRAVKLSGYWRVYVKGGPQEAQVRGDFHRALTLATGMPLVVSTKL